MLFFVLIVSVEFAAPPEVRGTGFVLNISSALARVVTERFTFPAKPLTETRLMT
jgi:hypothetical protein